jgi:hypothetical protein
MSNFVSLSFAKQNDSHLARNQSSHIEQVLSIERELYL